MRRKRKHSRKPGANSKVQNECNRFERVVIASQGTIAREAINYARRGHKGKSKNVKRGCTS